MSIYNNISQTLARDEETLLKKNFDSVRLRLEKAIAASGRKAGEVQLVAVSKWQSLPKIICVAKHWNSLGEKAIFSENYVQEALAKRELLASLPEQGDLDLEWHFTGHLQSNKGKQASAGFTLIHTLDSLSLAQNLQNILEKQLTSTGSVQKLPVLAQINLGQEESKFGLEKTEVEQFFDTLQNLNLLDVQGLMCLPPYNENAKDSRPYFMALRQMRDTLQNRLGITLPRLSMGMSHDFEIAVEEGATLVRVGTDIFGKRQY